MLVTTPLHSSSSTFISCNTLRKTGKQKAFGHRHPHHRHHHLHLHLHHHHLHLSPLVMSHLYALSLWLFLSVIPCLSCRLLGTGKESRLVTSPGLPRCCVDREILQGLRVPRWCSPLPHSDTPFPCHCQGSDCARCGMDKYGGNQGSK